MCFLFSSYSSLEKMTEAYQHGWVLSLRWYKQKSSKYMGKTYELLRYWIFEVCWLNILLKISMLFVGGFRFVFLLIKSPRDFSSDHGYVFLWSLCMFYHVPAGHATGRLHMQRCSCLQAVFPRTAGQLYGFYSAVSISVGGH